MFELGGSLIRVIIILLATLLIYFVFFEKLGSGGTQLNSGITSNLTDFVAG